MSYALAALTAGQQTALTIFIVGVGVLVAVGSFRSRTVIRRRRRHSRHE